MMVDDGGGDNHVLLLLLRGMVIAMMWMIVGIVVEVVVTAGMRLTVMTVVVVMGIMIHMQMVMFDNDEDGVITVMAEMEKMLAEADGEKCASRDDAAEDEYDDVRGCGNNGNDN